MKKLDKVIIVTGASSGIGLATCKYLINKGCKVYGIARRKFEGEFTCFQGDVTDVERMKEILAEVVKAEGRIDGIVNNAGFGISGAVENADPADVGSIFSVNLTAVVNFCAAALPYLRESRGRIVNISSVAAVTPIPYQACYSASKAAVLNFSYSLSGEVKPFGVKVSCVLPGDTRTGFTAARVKGGGGVYAEREKRSVEVMERDEQNGKPPETVAKAVYKCLKKRRPPLKTTVGSSYKLIVLLVKILPARLAQGIINKIYA